MSTQRLTFTFPAAIEMVMHVDPDTGAVTIEQSVVVPDQFRQITAAHIDGEGATMAAIDAATEWLESNDWPQPSLSADGVTAATN